VQSLVVASTCLSACESSAPSNEEQAKVDAKRDRELQEEIERSLAPYQQAVEEFFQATSAGQFERAYGMLATTYANMVAQESFVARIKTNKNFSQAVTVKVLHTQSQAGTTHARCILGSLGLAEIVFADGKPPRISAISLGGMPALPPPQ
jgi:hypothetical protein